MTQDEFVTWTTPFIRATQAAHQAGEHFEARQWDAGIQRLSFAREQFEQAASFVFNKYVEPKKGEPHAAQDAAR